VLIDHSFSIPHLQGRRLLYVACTRAQGLLYLTHSTKRMFAGESKTKDVSEFITAARKDNVVRPLYASTFARSHWFQNLFAPQLRSFTAGDRALIASVCGRPVPNETEVRMKVEEL